MKKILNYIDGELTEPRSGLFIDNYDPSRGIIYSLIPNSDAADVDAAVIAAKLAFPVQLSFFSALNCAAPANNFLNDMLTNNKMVYNLETS